MSSPLKFQHGMVAPLIALFVGVVGFPLGYAAYLSITDYKLTDRGAPTIVGTARKNENSAAVLRLMPIASAPMIVAPERLTPGTMARH